MYLYHGTKTEFDQFDVSYWGSGEAGTIRACWFTDNFEGARNHACYKNRNAGQPRVLRCKLSDKAVLADFGKMLSDQPELAAMLNKHLPVSISTLIPNGRYWHSLSRPKYYKDTYGKTHFIGKEGVLVEEQIELFRRCGIHGVHDWEGEWTDAYLKGSTTVIFDVSVIEIEEVMLIEP